MKIHDKDYYRFVQNPATLIYLIIILAAIAGCDRAAHNSEVVELESKLAEAQRTAIEVGQLKTKLAETERKASEAVVQEKIWRNINTKFLSANEDLQKLLKDKLDELISVDAKRIQGDKELQETTITLIKKMAIIDSLEKQIKLLLEEKTDLQNRLNQFLQQAGKAVAAPEPVTPIKEKDRIVLSRGDISLNGLVTAVDLKNSLAQISIGAANGVKQNMKFHVTRADKFICDIVILDVEPENAIGTLELMDVTKEHPKIGDKASTNL